MDARPFWRIGPDATLMPTDLPIACSLSAADMPKRLAEMAALGRDSLIGVDARDARALLRFERDDATRARLEAIVAAESECCAFLTMRVAEQPEALTLTVEAPPGGEPVMRDIVTAFTAASPAG